MYCLFAIRDFSLSNMSISISLSNKSFGLFRYIQSLSYNAYRAEFELAIIIEFGAAD